MWLITIESNQIHIMWKVGKHQQLIQTTHTAAATTITTTTTITITTITTTNNNNNNRHRYSRYQQQ